MRSLATAAVSGRMRGRDHDNMTTDLEVVVESDDVAVALGHLLEDGNLVADLRARGRKKNKTLRPTLHGEEWARSQDLGGWKGDTPGRSQGTETHHVFTALHELLVDDLTGIVLAGLDVYGLLHDGVRPAAEGLARPILSSSRAGSISRRGAVAGTETRSPGRGPSRGP